MSAVRYTREVLSDGESRASRSASRNLWIIFDTRLDVYRYGRGVLYDPSREFGDFDIALKEL